MTQIENAELQQGISYLRENTDGFKIPYNQLPSLSHETITEKIWNDAKWNPPDGSIFTTPDPEGSPKPTWEQIKVAVANYRVLKLKQLAEQRFSEPATTYLPDWPNSVRAEIADQDHILHDGDEVFVHGGIDRMTGLLQMVESSNESGQPIPHILMRDEGNQPINIYSQEQIRPLLTALAHRKNMVESGHNSVMRDYQAIADIRDDQTKTLDERLTAGNNAITFIQSYRTHLETAIAAYDKDALPADLDTLRDVYIERLEATALARAKWIRMAITEQANKLPETCQDQKTALEQVSQAEIDASIAVFGSSTVEAAKTAYDAGVSAINRVSPNNVAEYLIGATPLGANPVPQTHDGNGITIWADHPADANIDKPIILRIDLSRDGRKISRGFGVSFYQPKEGETRAGQTINFDETRAGQTITLDCRARSRCGPSDMQITVNVPAL